MRFIGVDSRVTRVIYGFPWQILIIRNRVGRIIKRWGDRALDRADGMAVLHPVRSRGLSKLGSKTRERVGLEVAGSDLTSGREDG